MKAHGDKEEREYGITAQGAHKKIREQGRA